MNVTFLQGDALAMLKTLPDETFHCVVTSPPYWGLRRYLDDDADGKKFEMGLEPTPEAYLARMVEVFREVRRVLHGDGVCWVNMGDSYAAQGGGGEGRMIELHGEESDRCKGIHSAAGKGQFSGSGIKGLAGLKPKDLCGVPWRLALALQQDGWWLRQDIIWSKPNPMPESVTDRCTKAHEYLFLLSKSARYFWDGQAIAEPCEPESWHNSDFRRARNFEIHPTTGAGERNARTTTRNRRSVWTIATEPYPEAHFATFPTELPKLCILAGTSARGACPKCGAPWERETSVQYENWVDGNNSGKRKGDIPDERMTFASGKRCEKRTTTTGWRPTCTCGESSTVPCRVLDPFAGSGTTGQVALELGRHVTLIELNPEYVKLARRRCDVTPGLPLA